MAGERLVLSVFSVFGQLGSFNVELTPFYRHLIFPAQLKLGILQGHGQAEEAVPCQFLGALNLLSNFRKKAIWKEQPCKDSRGRRRRR